MIDIILQNASIFLNILLLITSVYTLIYSFKMFVHCKSRIKLVYDITSSMRNMAKNCKIELYKSDDFFKISENKRSDFSLEDVFEIDNYCINF